VLLAVAVLFAGCKKVETTSEVTVGTPPAETNTAPPPTSTAFPSIPQPVISGTLPATVPIPAMPPKNATPEQFRPYFDWFSWESFIALNWPASAIGRGNPDQPNNPTVFASMTNATPVTWGTYKANWELYDQYDQRPTEWTSYKVPYAPSVCPQATVQQKQLVMVTKGDTELNDVNQAFSFPLVDQNKNFAFYEVRYNEWYYKFVRGADEDPKSWLYYNFNLPTNYTNVPLPPNAASPADSVMVKAAWRNIAAIPPSQQSRYYKVNAWVYNSSTNQCTQQWMGLVGFHIAVKTKDFPEWIWSTFEQLDNVPPVVDGVPSSFNNGKSEPPTGTHGFANRPQYQAPGQLPPNPTPTQVVRLNPIPTTPPGASTVDVNNTFHAALPKTSPWQFYELVVTQWPTNPASFKPGANQGVYPSGAGQPFPLNGAVNTTLETYFQSQQDAIGAGGNSCMSCHYTAQSGLRDFSWGFARRPHGDQPPPPSAKVKAMTQTAAK
jgi:hypothetical protein